MERASGVGALAMNIPETGAAPAEGVRRPVAGCAQIPGGEKRSQSGLNGQRIQCKVSCKGQIWIEAQILSLRIRPGINLAPNQG